jgi:hypothetical protein
MSRRPDPTEAAEYYFRYIDQVPDGDILETLKSQESEVIALLLPQEAWERRGTASDNPFSVNALAYLTAGHVAHHVRILREKYLRA